MFIRQSDDELFDDYRNELAAEDKARRRLRNQLSRHPDPRDPDWPGHWFDSDEDFKEMTDGLRHGSDVPACPVCVGAGQRTCGADRGQQHSLRQSVTVDELVAELKAFVRWHDQLGAADVARAKALIARAEEGQA